MNIISEKEIDSVYTRKINDNFSFITKRMHETGRLFDENNVVLKGIQQNLQDHILQVQRGNQYALLNHYHSGEQITSGTVSNDRLAAQGEYTTLVTDYNDHVAVHLHFDGTHGSSVYTDVRGATFTDDGASDIYTSTLNSKFGGSSAWFGGVGYAIYTSSTIPLLNVGTGDFTIEFWFNKHAACQLVAGLICNSSQFNIYFSPGQGIVLDLNMFPVMHTTTTVFTAGSWYHFALTRSGTTLRMFINGVLDATGSSSASINFQRPWIGYNYYAQPSTSHFVGYIDELRITSGIARYTSTFAVATAAFPDVDITYTPYLSSVQFNDNGKFGGNSLLTWDNINSKLISSGGYDTAGTYNINGVPHTHPESNATLQLAYDNSSNPSIQLTIEKGPVTFRDYSTVYGEGLVFEIQDYLGVNRFTVAGNGDVDGRRFLSEGNRWAHDNHGWEVSDTGAYAHNATNTGRVVSIPSGAAKWRHGLRYVSAGESITIEDTSGLHYVKWDTAGTLTDGESAWSILEDIPVMAIYWNSRLQEGIPIFEQHTQQRNLRWHNAAHLGIGTLAVPGGFSATGYSVNPATPTDLTNSFAIAAGSLIDEDITYPLSALSDGGNYTIAYRDEAAGTRIGWKTVAGVPFSYTTTALTALEYNDVATGAFLPLTAGRFVCYYVVAIQSIVTKFQFIMVAGQQQYTTLTLAQQESYASLNLGDFANLTEYLPIYKVIYKRENTGSQSGRASMQSFERIPGSRASIAVTTGGDHQALSNRNALEAHTLASITTGGLGYIPFGDATGHTVDAAFKYVSSVLYAPSASFSGLGGATGVRVVGTDTNGLLSKSAITELTATGLTTTAVASALSYNKITGTGTIDAAQIICQSDNAAGVNPTFGGQVAIVSYGSGNTSSVFNTVRASCTAIYSYNQLGSFLIGTLEAKPLILGTANTKRLTISATGTFTLANLAGTGSRIVVADAAGLLSASASATNLTSLAGLTYASASFVKMTAAGTFALDTSTYSLSSHVHALNTITTGGSGRIPFGDASYHTTASTFVYDAATGRLGIGIATPTTALFVKEWLAGEASASMENSNTNVGTISASARAICGSNITRILATSPLWTNLEHYECFQANGGVLDSTGAGGLSIVSIAQNIRFYAGGQSTAALALTISTDKSAAFAGPIRPDAIATPASPAVSAMQMYFKGSKFILQYNEGGTQRWKYLDLAGTGVTWVYSATAP